MTSHSKDLTLYDIETTLAALTNVEAGELEPELREAYEQALAISIQESAEKRDAIAFRLFDLSRQAALAHTNAQEYRNAAQMFDTRAQRFEKSADRLREYVIDVMRLLPKPAKGPRKLEGKTSTLKAQGVPPSVEFTDEALIEDEFKTVTVTMPAAIWRDWIPDADSAAIRADQVHWNTSKSQVKAALQNGRAVPGAKLVDDKLRLVVE